MGDREQERLGVLNSGTRFWTALCTTQPLSKERDQRPAQTDTDGLPPRYTSPNPHSISIFDGTEGNEFAHSPCLVLTSRHSAVMSLCSGDDGSFSPDRVTGFCFM